MNCEMISRTARASWWRVALFPLVLAGAGVWPDVALSQLPAPTHEYLFNDGTLVDTVGSADGTAVGTNVSFSQGQVWLNMNTGLGRDASVELLAYDGGNNPLGINIPSYSELTFAYWAIADSADTPQGLGNGGFHTTVAFGQRNTTNAALGGDYVFIQDHRGDNNTRGAISISNDGDPWSDESGVNGPELNDNALHHYALVITADNPGTPAVNESEMSLYVDGVAQGASPLALRVDNGLGAAEILSNVSDENAWIGDLYSQDPQWAGRMDQLRIWNQALTPAQLALDTLVPPDLPTLEVNRDTGQIRLLNNSSPFQMFNYTVSSAAGALDPDNWQSVTDNWDFDSGSVGNYFDPDDTDGFGNGWLESSSTNTQWAEASSSVFLGNGGLFDDGTNCDVCPLEIGLADAWTKSIYEDVDGTFTVAGGSTQDFVITYVGNGDQPFARSDLSFTNGVGPEDWTIFIANHLGDFTGMTLAQAYQLGDLDGDLDNDYDDWLLFGQDYDEANGAGAFAALLAGNVPEPTSGLLLLSGAGLLLLGRRRARKCDLRDGSTRRADADAPISRRRIGGALIAAALALFALLWQATSAQADVQHRYMFNDGTADDSVGSADGTLVFHGDYNNDERVSAADYTTYRNNLGMAITLPNERPNATPAMVTVEDYDAWTDHYATGIYGGQLNLYNPGGGAGGQNAAHVSLLTVDTDAVNGLDITSFTSASFEVWATVRDTNPPDWSRFFEIGGKSTANAANAGSSIFMSPDAGGATTLRTAISNVDPATQSGFDDEQQVNTTATITAGVEHQFLVTYNNATDSMRMYLDGVLVGTNPALGASFNEPETNPFGNLQTTFAFLGASLYDADPGYDGSINDFRIYNNALTGADAAYLNGLGADADTGDLPTAPSFMTLEVNTNNGNVTVQNNSGVPFSINSYDIESPGGALDLGGWNSFSDQILDPVDGGDDPGETWDEAGLSSSTHVAERFLLGTTTFAAGGGSETLGALFDESVFGAGSDGDLVFRVGLPGGELVDGNVVYVTSGAGTAVPEPSTAALLLVAFLFVAGKRRSRLAA